MINFKYETFFSHFIEKAIDKIKVENAQSGSTAQNQENLQSTLVESNSDDALKPAKPPVLVANKHKQTKQSAQAIFDLQMQVGIFQALAMYEIT